MEMTIASYNLVRLSKLTQVPAGGAGTVCLDRTGAHQADRSASNQHELASHLA